MYYQEYMTREEWDRIVNTDSGRDTMPHCNASTFHAPGVCPYCDSYYRQHPEFIPFTYETPEANGWGGNQAPTLDPLLAGMERAEIDRAWDDVFDFEFNLDDVDSMRSNAKGWRWHCSQFIPWRFQSTFWVDGKRWQSTTSWWQWRDRIWGEHTTFMP